MRSELGLVNRKSLENEQLILNGSFDNEFPGKLYRKLQRSISKAEIEVLAFILKFDFSATFERLGNSMQLYPGLYFASFRRKKTLDGHRCEERVRRDFQRLAGGLGKSFEARLDRNSSIRSVLLQR